MMFIYKTAKFASVWTTVLKIRAIFVHQTLTEHALLRLFPFGEMKILFHKVNVRSPIERGPLNNIFDSKNRVSRFL